MNGATKRLYPMLVLFLLPAAIPSAAPAQAIELRLREETTKAPVQGAIVRLLGSNGPVAQALTNEQGRVALSAPAPGIYHVKADRIGYRGVLIGPIEVAVGDTYRHDIDMPSTRLELPTIEVQGKSACKLDGQEGTLAAALWEEVQKALTAHELTRRQRAVPLHVRLFHRELDRNGNALREWVYLSSLVHGQPFSSAPAARLAQSGFVEDADSTSTYNGPDAALLLSDAFIETHCFRSVPGKDRLVGLAFEPAPGRKLTDVRGTLWVDRASSELQFLEYDYTGLSGARAEARLGGRVEFRRLRSGEWIVWSWHIRMPTLVYDTVPPSRREPGFITERLAGYVEEGGRSEIAEDGVIPVARAIVLGRIYDSTTGRGLTGAFVQVRGYRDSVLTDGDGRFQLVVAGAGPQTAVATHPKLGLLRTLPLRPVLLSLGDTVHVEFAVPSIPTFVRAFCRSSRNRSGVVGLAHPPSGVAAEAMDVSARWRTTAGQREQRTAVGRDGVFAFCDLPYNKPIELWLTHEREILKEATLQLSMGRFVWLDLVPSGIVGVALPPIRPPR